MKKLILFLFGLIVLSSLVCGTDLTTLNVIHYSFDNSTLLTTTVIDNLADTKFNGTKKGAGEPAQWGSGKLSDAVHNDNTDDYITTNRASYDYADFTYNCWIKKHTKNSIDTIIMGAKSDGTNIQGMWTDTSGLLKAQVQIQGGTSSNVLDGPVINNNTLWHMITLTVDYNAGSATVLVLYMNATMQENQTNFNWNAGNDNGNINIGRFGDLANHYFDGLIDECSIWNRSLTKAEVQQLYNSGSGKAYSTWNPKFTINAYDFYWSTQLSNFSAVVNGTTYNSNISTKTITTTITKGPNVNITVRSKGYYNKTYTNWDTDYDLGKANLTINHTVLNVTARDYNNDYVTNFTITADSLNSSHIATNTTTKGSARLNLKWNETYNVTIGLTNYILNNDTTPSLSNYMNLYYEKLNFTGLRELNTINITFKDEDTLDILNSTNVTYELISGTYSMSNITDDGTAYLTLITPEDYQIRYSAPGYPQRIHSFTLTNETYNILTLYLTDSAENVTTTVYDDWGNIVEGATIKVLKYDTSTNSYIQVEESTTNFEGQTVLHLKLASEFYKFRIYYGGDLKLSSDPTYVYSNSITFQISLIEESGTTFFQNANIQYNLTFNPTTNNFKFDFNDVTGLTTQACLFIKSTVGIYETDYNDSCVNATSGSILLNIAEVNGTTYKASAYAYPGGLETFLESLTKSFNVTSTSGYLGLFLILLVTVLFAFIGISNPVVALIITPLPLLFGSIAGIVDINRGIMLLVEVIAIILAFVIGDKS